MDSTDFPGNARSARQPSRVPSEPTNDKRQPRQVERVVTSDVKVKKKSFLGRAAENFLGGDIHQVGSYVVFDVVIPQAKDMIIDVITQGVERTFWGEVRDRGRRSSGYRPSAGYSPHTDYGRYSRPGREPREPRREPSRRGRDAFEFDEILYPMRAEADAVLDNMFETAGKYGEVTVADMYSMAGQTPEYTYHNWGWSEDALREVRVGRHQSSFVLNLPKPEPIDR